jgi:hypothetical protein
MRAAIGQAHEFLRTLTRPWRAVVAAFVVTRVVAWVAAWYACVHATPGAGAWHAFPDQPLLDGWARWDSGWYWTLADGGYQYTRGVPSNVNFFPLFPLVAKLAAPLFAHWWSPAAAFYVAGILISNIAFMVALRGIYALVCERADAATATRAVWAIAVFPFSLFFTAAYSEGIYLATAVWAFWFARRDRWLPACALAGATAVTRIVGVLVVGGVALEYLLRRPRPWRLDRYAVCFVVAAAPLVALLVYFWMRFDDPFVFAKTQALWGRRPGVHHLVRAVEWFFHPHSGIGGYLLLGWYLGGALFAAVFSLRAWRRFGAPMALFALASLLLAIATGVAGIGRYVAVLFPAFMAVATSVRGLLFACICVVCIAYLAYFSSLFALWLPVN